MTYDQQPPQAPRQPAKDMADLRAAIRRYLAAGGHSRQIIPDDAAQALISCGMRPGSLPQDTR